MISEDATKNEQKVKDISLTPSLPFSHYIAACRSIIAANRTDLANKADDLKNLIIETNSPFELNLKSSNPDIKHKYGALLVHGLFDSPFSLKEIALNLQANHIPSKAVLLPGHGTNPKDLIDVSYQDWINTVQYGIDILQKEVENLIIIGYSTGATLGVYHALLNPAVKGLVLLSPAVKIKLPIEMVLGYQQLKKWVSKQKEWVMQVEEDDYAKYRSFPFNPVLQVENLTEEVKKLSPEKTLTCPLFMAISKHDETVSYASAADYFVSHKNEKNKMIVYGEKDDKYEDSRIIARSPQDPIISIQNLSHISVPFSPKNFHYGLEGDYPHAPRTAAKHTLYGAYTRVEIKSSDFLYEFGMVKQKRRSLTYNPDFDYLMETINTFIPVCE